MRRLFLASLLLALGVRAGMAQEDAPLPTLLARAADYVEHFADRLSGVVMSEAYVQDVFLPIGRVGARPFASRGYTGPLHRALTADLLLVHPIGANAWMQFRDVVSVDGRVLKGRNDRLARLFLQPSASTAAQARNIMAESARYNIGDIERNINLPVLALVVLGRTAQSGFRFSLDALPVLGPSWPKDPAFTPPVGARVVRFVETQSHTLVATPAGMNMPTHGRFWIDPRTAQVLLSEIGIDDQTLRADIQVAYAPVEAIHGVPVPVRMHERYENRLNGTVVEGTAAYANVRSFDVQVDESMAPIK